MQGIFEHEDESVRLGKIIIDVGLIFPEDQYSLLIKAQTGINFQGKGILITGNCD